MRPRQHDAAGFKCAPAGASDARLRLVCLILFASCGSQSTTPPPGTGNHGATSSGAGASPALGSGSSGGAGGVGTTGASNGSSDGTTSGTAMGAGGTSGGVSGASSGTGNTDGGDGGGAGSGSGSSSGAGIGGDGGSSNCGAGDPKLPAEPTFPPVGSTLGASLPVSAGGVPSESALDTSRIQMALNACSSGQAVKLTSAGANNAFVTGPLTVPSGVTLWVDAGATLYGTRDPNVYGSASALITVTGANSGIVGDGTIDGQGGEPKIGSSQSWWDANGSGGSSPALIAVSGATNFTLYRITLHNSPKFHVKLAANGFVVWGVTIKTPSAATNSQGTALSPSSAHNTDGIDPGEAASNGYIVCSKISDGDDNVAIKGNSGVDHLTIAHNRFGAGHGMSIGSEFTGGVSNIDVYDLSIDGMNSGLSGGSSNGIRIKSDSSRGGLVNNVTYSDVCVRNLTNPIILTTHYSTATGTYIPQYTGITIQNFRSLGSSVTPHVTLDGYDAAHMLGITFDNVVVDGVMPANVSANYANVTLGPGNVNFTLTGTGVTVTNAMTGSSQPNACSGKWTTF